MSNARSTHALALTLAIVVAAACAPPPVDGDPVPVRVERVRFSNVEEIIIADSGEARPRPGLPRIEYPRTERNTGVEASFAMAFVLDTAGRVERNSVSLVGTSPPAFFKEACRWLGLKQFETIRRAGAPRRALVVWDFTFDLIGAHDGIRRARPAVEVESIRQMFASQGVETAARQLAQARHCDDSGAPAPHQRSPTPSTTTDRVPA